MTSASSQLSRLDRFYRRLLLSGFFSKGWGDPAHMRQIFALRRRVVDPREALTLVRPELRRVEVLSETTEGGVRRTHGSFESPCVGMLDDALLPPECRNAHFELVEPADDREYGRLRPICLQFAGTGDHFFWRRRRLAALPMLAERGVSSLIIENPFYGLRKPKDQMRSSLRNVTDIFVMGACLIAESLVQLRWLREERGFGPAIYHGVSMGGHMATLSATVAPEPVGVVPCLAWTSASLTFTEGVLSGAINWPILESQLLSTREYRRDILAMCSSERNAFKAGVDLAHVMEEKIKKEGNDDQMNLANRSDPPVVQDEGKSWASSTLSSIYSSLDSILSALRPLGSSPAKVSEDDNEEKWAKEDLRQEALHFMRGIMDECTHLQNFPVPLDPTLCLAVAAERDAYQPRDGVRPITQVWPGSRIKYLEGEGHISSYLFKQAIFREAIYEVLDMLVEKHYNGNGGGKCTNAQRNE